MKGVLEQLGMHVLGPAATTLEARRLLAPNDLWQPWSTSI